MVTPDPRSPGPRGPGGGFRLIVGAIIAAVLLIAIMLLLTGPPDPERGESLPNAPSLTD